MLENRPIGNDLESLHRLRNGLWMRSVEPRAGWHMENVFPNVVRESHDLQKYDEAGLKYLARTAHQKFSAFYRDNVPTAVVTCEVIKHGPLERWQKNSRECLQWQAETGFIFWHDIRKGAIALIGQLNIALHTQELARRSQQNNTPEIDLAESSIEADLRRDPSGILLLQNALFPTIEWGQQQWLGHSVHEYFSAGAQLALDIYTQLYPTISNIDYRTRTQKRIKR